MPLTLLNIIQNVQANMKICSVDGCNRVVYAKNICAMHYGRFRRKGHINLLRGNAPVGARNKFNKHKLGAKDRNILFLLTFEEWMKIWFDSGHWHERGTNKGQYVMARFNDIGPYAIGNVKIILNDDNVKECHCGAKKSYETRQKISLKAKGHKRWVGKKHTQKTKDKIRLARLRLLKVNNTQETI